MVLGDRVRSRLPLLAVGCSAGLGVCGTGGGVIGAGVEGLGVLNPSGCPLGVPGILR